MKFNSDKFELLRYGKNQQIKDETIYFSADNDPIEEKEVLRDLGIMMNNDATFKNHIDKVCKIVKQKSGWILRTFVCRKPHILKLLWKSLVQPNIDYCSQLYMPVSGNGLNELENLQRHFTSRIPSTHSMDYWTRLTHLQMLSQQRRMERYRIIYVWKVLEGLVPNCGLEAESNTRLGRLCSIPTLTNTGKFRTLRENSFQVHGPKLFNSLPIKIRSITKCSVNDFKTLLDKVLSQVPDEPNISGIQYTPRACDLFTGRPSNSILDQIRGVEFKKNRKA